MRLRGDGGEVAVVEDGVEDAYAEREKEQSMSRVSVRLDFFNRSSLFVSIYRTSRKGRGVEMWTRAGGSATATHCGRFTDTGGLGQAMGEAVGGCACAQGCMGNMVRSR